MFSLATASEVLISGSSAGGLAAFLHADWWCDAIRAATNSTGGKHPRLSANGTNGPLRKCAALPDSGFFLDYESPRATTTPPPANYRAGYYRAYMDWAFGAFNASGGLHSDCVAAMAVRGTPSLCTATSTSFGTISEASLGSLPPHPRRGPCSTFFSFFWLFAH